MTTAPVGFWTLFFFFLLRRNISAGGLGVGKMEITVVEIRGSRESLKVECWDSDVLMEVVVDIRYLDKDKINDFHEAGM